MSKRFKSVFTGIFVLVILTWGFTLCCVGAEQEDSTEEKYKTVSISIPVGETEEIFTNETDEDCVDEAISCFKSNLEELESMYGYSNYNVVDLTNDGIPELIFIGKKAFVVAIYDWEAKEMKTVECIKTANFKSATWNEKGSLIVMTSKITNKKVVKDPQSKKDLIKSVRTIMLYEYNMTECGEIVSCNKYKEIKTVYRSKYKTEYKYSCNGESISGATYKNVRKISDSYSKIGCLK